MPAKLLLSTVDSKDSPADSADAQTAAGALAHFIFKRSTTAPTLPGPLLESQTHSCCFHMKTADVVF